MPKLAQQGSNNSRFYDDTLEIFLSNVIYFAHLFPFGMLSHEATLGLAFPSLENNPVTYVTTKKKK